MKIIWVFAASIILVLGCGSDKEDKSFVKKTGNAVGETLTEFATGVGEGVDEKLKAKVELEENLINNGVSKTISKSHDNEKGFTVYLLSKNKFKTNLLSKALDKDDQEIGRANVEVEFAENDAKYINFIFPKELDMQLVKRFKISIKE